MEKQLAKIVNRALAGEPQNVVLQVTDTLKIFEFSQIKYVDEAGVIRDVTLIDDTLDQTEIQHILQNMGHSVEITFDETDNVTLYF
jgi:phosphatidate phosphatase APP1